MIRRSTRAAALFALLSVFAWGVVGAVGDLGAVSGDLTVVRLY